MDATPMIAGMVHKRLEEKVKGSDAAQLSLVASRSNVLEGLCAQFGVDEMFL